MLKKLGSSIKIIKHAEDSIPTTSSIVNSCNIDETKSHSTIKNVQKCNDGLQSKIRRNSDFYIEASHGVLQNLNDDEFSGQFLVYIFYFIFIYLFFSVPIIIAQNDCAITLLLCTIYGLTLTDLSLMLKSLQVICKL